jgi:hypothetical protein
MKYVVFGTKAFSAAIRLAYREGLVELQPGVRPDLLTEESDSVLEQQVREQLVLTPNIIGLKDHPLLSEPVLKDPSAKDLVLTKVATPDLPEERGTLPLEMVAAMLKVGGHGIPGAEIMSRLHQALEVEGLSESLQASGHQVPDLGHYASKLLGHDPFPPEAWAMYERRRQAQVAAAPIVEAIREARAVLAAAAQHQAHGMIPYLLSQPGHNGIHPMTRIDPRLGYNANAIVLLRVVVKGVGAPLPQDSLKGTMRLANSPEADALRHKIEEWYTILARGDWGSLAPVEAEIKRAIASLEKRNLAQQWGDCIFYLTVPVQLAEAIVEARFPSWGYTSVASTSMELFSRHLETYIRQTDKHYRWAYFGRG